MVIGDGIKQIFLHDIQGLLREASYNKYLHSSSSKLYTEQLTHETVCTFRLELITMNAESRKEEVSELYTQHKRFQNEESLKIMLQDNMGKKVS